MFLLTNNIGLWSHSLPFLHIPQILLLFTNFQTRIPLDNTLNRTRTSPTEWSLRDGSDFKFDEILFFLYNFFFSKLPIRHRFETSLFLVSYIERQNVLQFMMQLLGFIFEICMMCDVQIEMLALFGYLICKSKCLQVKLRVSTCGCRYFRSIVDLLQACNLLLHISYLFLVIFNFHMLYLQLFQWPISLTSHYLTFIAINHTQS